MKKSTNCIRTQKEVRNLFFEIHEQFKSEQKANKKHNDYSCDCRQSFCFFIDYLQRDGQITMNQAAKYTL